MTAPLGPFTVVQSLQPVWTPFNRPVEDHPSRKKYVATYIDVEEKKEE
jgi:hypothetical protein